MRSWKLATLQHLQPLRTQVHVPFVNDTDPDTNASRNCAITVEHKKEKISVAYVWQLRYRSMLPL